MGVSKRDSSVSVWGAEHGSSSPVSGGADGANAGHRFRIHGRLGRALPEQLESEEAAHTSEQGEHDPGERLREQLAQATEIDLADVHIDLGDEQVVLLGTVADDGERRQLEDLVARLTHEQVVSHVRPRNP